MDSGAAAAGADAASGGAPSETSVVAMTLGLITSARVTAEAMVVMRKVSVMEKLLQLMKILCTEKLNRSRSD
jgi:hypothetical protein